jgi:hypothetical protein
MPALATVVLVAHAQVARHIASGDSDMRKTSGQPGKGTKKTDVKRGAAKLRARNPAAHIMAAPKGARTVSHRRIEEAVDKVFRERSLTHA